MPPGRRVGEGRGRIGIDRDMRRVVDGRDGDGGGGFRGSAVAVRDAVGERVGAVVVVVRIVFERAISVEQQRAVSRAGDGRYPIGGVAIGIDHGQRVAIGIGVVAQHIAGDDVIFERIVAIGIGNRGAVEADQYRVGISEMSGA